MAKVVINKCFGGFGITTECLKLYNELSDKKIEYDHLLERDDPNLIKAIEQLGVKKASDSYAELQIIEIPEGKEWEIDEYDGCESIHEKAEHWG